MDIVSCHWINPKVGYYELTDPWRKGAPEWKDEHGEPVPEEGRQCSVRSIAHQSVYCFSGSGVYNWLRWYFYMQKWFVSFLRKWKLFLASGTNELWVNRALFVSLYLTETGVMEASLSDYCRQQGELRQGMFHQPPLFAVNSEHVVDTGPIPFPSYNITTMPNKTGSALLTLFFSFQKCYA